MELTEKQRFWKAHIESAEEFEGTQADYARQHQLDIKKFYFFKASLRDKGALSVVDATGFSRVSIPSSSVQPGVQVMLPNGVRLSLPDAPGLLERLARL